MAQTGSDMLPTEFFSVSKTLGISALKFWNYIWALLKFMELFFFFQQLLADFERVQPAVLLNHKIT